MRKFMWLAALTVGLAWAGAAHAQSSSASSSGSSGSTTPISKVLNILKFPKAVNVIVQPNITNNSAMDYRNQSSPIGTTTYSVNTTGTAFPYTLSSMFYTPTRTNSISNTITFGQSAFPTPTQMQAAAPGFLSAFQMYRAAPITP